MKCPKCGYLGFESADRCRNCGYDFELARDVDAVPELPLRSAPQTERFPDLSIVAPSQHEALTTADLDRDLENVLAAPAGQSAPGRPAPDRSATAARAPIQAAAPSATATDLPLFGGSTADDAPLITRASPPRPPLAVRRATPEVPRVRGEAQRPQTLDLALDLDLPPSMPPVGRARAKVARWPEPVPEAADDAGLGARLLAALIDLVVLGLVDAAVVYFTMQICGLTAADLGILPKGPLLAFLIIQNGGYLVAFTVGGQTLGKMAVGLRVVSAGSGASVDLTRAMLRTLIWAALAIPAGLGFLSAVFSSDRRGVHDRLAGTRVVRV